MRKIITYLLFVILLFIFSPMATAEILIQVQSGQDAEAAQKEADRLFQLGAPSFSRAEQVPNLGVWNRVYIGPFENEADAKTAAESFLADGIIKEYIVKTGAAPEVGTVGPADPSGQNTAETPAPPESDNTQLPPEDREAVEAPTGSPQKPFELPRSEETPTYNEPVSPEQAKEMGLGPGESKINLPRYGDTEAVRPNVGGETQTRQEKGKEESEFIPPKENFKIGDDMPGILPPLPTSPGSSAPEVESGNVDGATDKQTPVPAPSPADDTTSSLPLAPSAGDNDNILLAQAKNSDSYQRSRLGPMTLAGFTMLVDLSSSMRRMAPPDCGGRIKEEAMASLIRKMNRRIPNHPYNASLRVFGYKRAWTSLDFTTLYYGPTTYNTEDMEDAIARLAAADSVSPFASALKASDSELQSMGNPKAILMFADFEPVIGSGDPEASARSLRRRYNNDVSVYTFYVTRQVSAPKLAKQVAKAGGGKAYDMCRMLSDEEAFENMMMDIFGPGGTPCLDADGDGVCDDDDVCPNTPPGAPVDERGCWIAAYSQFFDFDKAEVKKSFLPRIKHAAEVLKNNPGLPKVIIAGYTDNVGNPDYNMRLGSRRAAAVKKLLVSYGVSESKLTTESYGETRPVATNDTEEGRARNRRVEFHIGEVPPHRSKF